MQQNDVERTYADINKAKNIMDVCIIEPYKSLYSTLFLTFCNPILKHS